VIQRLEDLPRLDFDIGPDEVLLFCVVRNERARLPHLVRHYQALGVDRMFFVDNGSTDGSAEWLDAQPGCHVLTTHASYAEANYGTDWANLLVSRLGVGHWCLLVDADELFVFPDFETVPIQQYIQALEEEGAEAVFAFMLDMYPEGPLASAMIHDETDIVDAAPLFDADYLIQPPPGRPGKQPGFPGLRVLGGPRQRFTGSLEQEAKRGWLSSRLRSERERLIGALPAALRRRFIKFLWDIPPIMQKIPFAKAKPEFRFNGGAHSCTPVRLTRESAVLLHFKFLADFHERVLQALAEGEHYLGGAQYLWYKEVILGSGRPSLAYPGSLRYDGSRSLREAGFFKDLSSLTRYCS